MRVDAVQVWFALMEWLKEPDNRGAVQVLGGLAVIGVAWATGLMRWLVGAVKGKPKAAPPQGWRMDAQSGGVNIAGNARDVATGAPRSDDPA